MTTYTPVYRYFFRTRLPAIVQTMEFDYFFDRLEGPDAENINAQFRNLVQTALFSKKFVSLPQSTANISTEREEENHDDDSADSDYVPDDEENGDDEMENEDQEDKEAEEDSDSEDELETMEESSDEEE